MKTAVTLLALLATAIFAQQKGSFTDYRDKKTYKTVQIDKQVWLAENLNYEIEGSKCYNNNASNCATYGRLYDWETAMKVCPVGWLLPTPEDWNILTATVGGKDTEGKVLKSRSLWHNYDGKIGVGDDKYGFSALPAGLFSPDGFSNVGQLTFYWVTSENGNNAYFRGFSGVRNEAEWGEDSKSSLLSVRCIKSEVEIAERDVKAQRQNDEVSEGVYSNLASALNPSLAKKMASLFTEISTNITNENIGTNAQNDVTWRKRWIKRLTDTENMFYTIFSNRGKPYTLFYSTGIKQGKINYQTETIELSAFLNLRMNDNWVGILDLALQTVKAMDDKLQSTGRRGDWDLNDWPNTGITKTNPFSNTFYGGGMSGTTRYGTLWKTDFTIVVELLNNKNRVIGKQAIDISSFFEIYCNNRNFYGSFVEYGEHGGTIVDSDRAIRLRNELNNIKTITFNNVKVSDISDIMTIRIASINKNNPKNAGIQIIPLSESDWSKNDWNEKPKQEFYFR